MTYVGMPHKSVFKEALLVMLKILLVATVVYGWLTIKNFYVGEEIIETKSFSDNIPNSIESISNKEISNTPEFESLEEKYIHEAITQIKDPSHFAAGSREYKMKFQEICLNNILICTSVDYEWEFDAEEKYMYLASIVYVIDNIDANIIWADKVQKILDKIVINKDSWNRRWYANKYKVVINLWSVDNYSEFLELITHEIWHVVDLWAVEWTSRKKDYSYTEFDRAVFAEDDKSINYYSLSWKSEKVRNADADEEDFCSGYGMSDPFEDFAECFNLYMNHNAMFKYLARKNTVLNKKYNYIATLMDGEYLFTNSRDLNKIRWDLGWRPWDTTRIR